jgi:antitoxin (DNA-binding transcriptional repressor) of toxin-antitoxin stability system
MNTNIVPTKIGSRELVRNLKKIKTAVARGEAFDVQDHGVTAFHIIPPTPEKVIKYTWEDLKKIQFSSGDKHMADNIDKIVYGF